MAEAMRGPLGDLADSELYSLLGDALLEQYTPSEGDVYFLASPEEVGRSEYALLRAPLSIDLRKPVRNDVVACVSTTIRRLGVWRMPATVVAVLVVRHGLHNSAEPITHTAVSGGARVHSMLELQS